MKKKPPNAIADGPMMDAQAAEAAKQEADEKAKAVAEENGDGPAVESTLEVPVGLVV